MPNASGVLVRTGAGLATGAHEVEEMWSREYWAPHVVIHGEVRATSDRQPNFKNNNQKYKNCHGDET